VGTRTPDPLHAKQVLYQLSYIPTGIRNDLEDCTRRLGHLSKQMRMCSRAVGLALLSCAAVVVAAVPIQAAPLSTRVASGRCNSQTIDEAYSRVRDYDHHGPGGSGAQLQQRVGALADVLATLSEEREILDSICSSDAARAPLFAELAATAAWALALESDVATRLNASCSAAAAALPTIMLADAWLSMARVVNDANGTVPGIFTDVIPKVQSRATTIGLTLPPWTDTSVYWRDRVAEKARALAATCPPPSPRPSGSARPRGSELQKVFANRSQMN
jgi:hypothetical protein